MSLLLHLSAINFNDERAGTGTGPYIGLRQSMMIQIQNCDFRSNEPSSRTKALSKLSINHF